MHPEHYTDLDNVDTVENNLRHSAKGSNDAYDVTHSLTRSRSPKSWDNMTDPVGTIGRNLYGHPSAGLRRERKLAEVLSEEGWEKGYQDGNASACIEKRFFLSISVEDVNMAGIKKSKFETHAEKADEQTRS